MVSGIFTERHIPSNGTGWLGFLVPRSSELRVLAAVFYVFFHSHNMGGISGRIGDSHMRHLRTNRGIDCLKVYMVMEGCRPTSFKT